MVDKKRKAAENKTPAKKRKVETPKRTPSSAKKSKTPTPKKVISTKGKKTEVKKTPKPGKSPAKPVKTPQKASKPAKTPAKKEAAKPTPKKDAKKLAAKTVTRAKVQKKKPTAMKAKVDKAKALKAKAAAAKAKLKSTKTATKPKIISKPVKANQKVAAQKKSANVSKPDTKNVKKSEVTKKPEAKDEQKKEVKKVVPIKAEKKETPKAKAVEKKQPATESSSKRKNTNLEEESSETPRKKRMITPNKKFADFELDVPAKRTITPNKKYADFETDTSSKRVSELRAFIQDKKKSPTAAETPKSEKSTKAKASTPSASTKPDDEKKETPGREIKVFKQSEMKPAEKLMKKLQKKLEKEAKSAASPKPVENREKAKIKITKVVTYNKPMSSDEKEMRAIKATPKSKTVATVKPIATESSVKTPKQSAVKTNAAKVAKPTPKATPKAKAPEKQPPKPKKIKELRKEERPIQAKFLCEKNIKFKDDNDKLNCWITGIGVFPSGEIIMVDMTNRKIKLFSKDFDFLSQVKLDTIPQDISVSPVNASDAYFTKPFSKEGIQKVTMSDGKLTLKESFWTNGTNRGITCTKAGILTSVQDGRYHDLDINHFKIDLLDYEGKVLQTVSTDSNGSRLFKLPLYFTVNSTGKQMIVADCIKNFSYVVSLDMTGKVKFKYEGVNNNLVTPRGLTIDDEDNIYVTEWERHNVYVLSPAGKRLQVLFNDTELKEEGLSGLQKPYQLCFYHDGDMKKLIVSQEGCNTVKVFQMLKKGPKTDAPKEAAADGVTEKKALPNGETANTVTNSAAPKVESSVKAPVSTPDTVVKGIKNVEKAVETGKKDGVENKVAQVKGADKGTSTIVYVKTVEPSQVIKDTKNVPQVKQEDSVKSETEKQLPATNAEPSKVSEVKGGTEESPPVINAEFGDEFDTAENEMEENPSVQDAINSLNDSKEQIVADIVPAEPVSESHQMQVETYEQLVEMPQVQTEAVSTQVSEIAGAHPEGLQMQEGMQVQEEMQVQEGMQVQQLELVNTQYDQVIVPHVEEIITTQPVDTEIQSVPMESVAHETIIIQQDINQMNPQYEKIETVTVNNNDANNVMQGETVQYVTNVSIGENYATNIAQGEIVTEVPEEIVTMVTETV